MDKDSKELNLVEIISITFKGIFNLFIRIFKGLGSIAHMIINNWVVFLLTIILCVAIGAFLSRPSAHKFKAGTTAYIASSEANFIKDICRQLTFHDSDNVSLSLSKKLDIPKNVAQNIVSINTYNFIDYLKDGTPDEIDFKDKRSVKDTTSVILRDRLYIQVITKDIEQIPIIQNAILKFINSNPRLVEEFEVFKLNVLDKIAQSEKEMQRLDSLSQVSYFKDINKELSFADNKLTIGEQHKQLFYGDVLHLQDVIAHNKQVLARTPSPVYFASDFVIDTTPVNNQKKYLLIGFLIGAIIGTVFAFLLDKKRIIIDFIKNK